MENNVLFIEDYATVIGGKKSETERDGGAEMNEKNYTKNEVDLKLENLQLSFDSKLDLISSKIEHLPDLIKIEMMESAEKQKKERKNETLTIIGVIVGILGIVVPLIQTYLASKQ